MLEIKDRKKYLMLFDNIYEFSQYLINKQKKPGRENESNKDDYSFTGTRSFQEAMDLMLYGDEDILKQINAERKKINVDRIIGNAIKRNKYENNIYGCVPNVPAFLVGTPINMINREPKAISQKIINIFLDVTAPWHVDKQTILENGVLYLTVIDLLEKSGYRCNLYAGSTSSFSDGSENNLEHYMLVRVKTDREPLNLKKICFTIANPSMLRRMYFRWAEVNDFEYDCTHDGYGQFIKESEIDKYLKEKTKNDFVVWTYKKSDDDKGLEVILENLKKKGISLD